MCVSYVQAGLYEGFRGQRGEQSRVMLAQRSEAKGIPASSLIGEEMSAILDCSGEKRLMR